MSQWWNIWCDFEQDEKGSCYSPLSYYDSEEFLYDIVLGVTTETKNGDINGD